MSQRSRGFARGEWEMLLPFQPPRLLPCQQGCTNSTSVTGNPVKLTCIIGRDGAPPVLGHAHPTAWGEREVKRMRRTQSRCKGLSREPTKCLGCPDPWSEARP